VMEFFIGWVVGVVFAVVVHITVVVLSEEE